MRLMDILYKLQVNQPFALRFIDHGYETESVSWIDASSQYVNLLERYGHIHVHMIEAVDNVIVIHI